MPRSEFSKSFLTILQPHHSYFIKNQNPWSKRQLLKTNKHTKKNLSKFSAQDLLKLSPDFGFDLLAKRALAAQVTTRAS